MSSQPRLSFHGLPTSQRHTLSSDFLPSFRLSKAVDSLTMLECVAFLLLLITT